MPVGEALPADGRARSTVGGAVAGLSFVGAPVVAVVAGVASGVYHGTLDSLHKTGDELGGLATSAWHDVTSIF